MAPIPARSPSFRIDTAARLYGPLLANVGFFFQTQQDGPDVDPTVMHRKPSHLQDRHAWVYAPPIYIDDVLKGKLQRTGGPIDVSGGWFDAGDYLKFVDTGSYVDAMLLYLTRRYPSLLQGSAAALAREGRYGLDWLGKMWNEQTRTLYYQVGIGNGDGGTILGDHDFWQLPQTSDHMNVKPGDPAYYIKYRPVFAASSPGSPISPNLAGRLAADFGLCFQLYHRTDPSYAADCLRNGETIYDLANTANPARLRTISPHDGYPETSWRDDMELGAVELNPALSAGDLPAALPHADPMFYLRQAAACAHAYSTGPDDGADTLNLYDVSGLAHAEFIGALSHARSVAGLPVDKIALLADLKRQVESGITTAQADPFGLGIGYGEGDATPHAIGLAVEANLYDGLAGTTTFARFAQEERDWVLGRNAWGSSFVVGAGAVFPHCMQHQIANLSGSLDGSTPIILGAVTDGPSASANFKGLGGQSTMRVCPADGVDRFVAFTGKGVRYQDNAVDWPSVEPADDYTVISALLFAQLLAGQ
jgi:endoglucanase